MRRQAVFWCPGTLVSLWLLIGSGVTDDARDSAQLHVTDPRPAVAPVRPYLPPKLGAPDSRVSGATRGLRAPSD